MKWSLVNDLSGALHYEWKYAASALITIYSAFITIATKRHWLQLLNRAAVSTYS